MFLAVLGFGASAQGLSSLLNLCPAGGRVSMEMDCVMDLTVVSDCGSDNMASAVNVTAGRLDDRWNRRTVYVQTADGSMGAKLVFVHPGENFLRFGDAISLSLDKCVISRDAGNGALEISGVRASNVRSVSHNQAVPPKIREISALTDADIYTYVEIQGLDIVFPDGSYSNIQESWASKMDGYLTLLRDDSGNGINMIVNAACRFRRTGKSLPSRVNLRGVLVGEKMRRYGNDIGRYSIRPIDENGIVPLRQKAAWKTLAGWVKPEGSSQSLEFEINGIVGGLFNKGVKNDRIYNDAGNVPALLWTDSDSEVRVYSGYNGVSAENDGFVGNGALMFITPTVSWYEWDGKGCVTGSKAFYIQLSTSKYKSGLLQLALEWSAGTQDGNKSCWFPVDWKAEYSLDGINWTLLEEIAIHKPFISLHSVPWGDCVIKHSGHDFKLQAGFDTAPGPQQHSFSIPSEAMGQKELLLRISPASRSVAKPRVSVSDSYRDLYVEQVPAECQSWIRIEAVKIDYRQ